MASNKSKPPRPKPGKYQGSKPTKLTPRERRDNYT